MLFRSVKLKSPLLLGGDNNAEFVIEPIGIYFKPDSQSKLLLAKKRASQPSGYFLLRKISISEKHDVPDMSPFSIGVYTLNNDGSFAYMDDVCKAILQVDKKNKKLSFDDIFKDKEFLKKRETGVPYQVITSFNDILGGRRKVLVCHRPAIENESPATGIITRLPEKEGKSPLTSNLDLIDSSPIATAIVSIKGEVLRDNKSFRMLAQRLGAKNNTPNLLVEISKEASGDIEDIIKEVISGKHDAATPYEIKIDGNNESSASLYISPIINSDSSISNLMVHLIDITELKNLELRFGHSQKMQAVGQLAGGIAHDFNNLLTAMMGFCDLLLIKHPAGDQSFADIMQIKQNANRAANLVRQLLAFSRKQTLQPEIINITDVLADLSNLIGRLIGENIGLKMVHGRDLGNVRVDQGQLEQVIINLAVNARDAMPDGGSLTIRTSNYTVDKKHKVAKNMLPPAEDEQIENGEYVLIEVVDSGCGIDKNEVGKIFEPFYSTKAVGAGTGLGLSTVYGIIKQTDGYIYVTSRKDKGTKFSIFLKRFDEVEKEKLIEVEHAHDKAALSDLSGSGNVLLVEDETPVRIFSNSALISKGYTVVEADCAEAAMRVMEEKGDQIDIIITDVMMPGMSGPDMIKNIIKTYPDVKVVFISGYGEDAFIESFGSERKFNFLSKPYTLKQLAAKVKDVLESK